MSEKCRPASIRGRDRAAKTGNEIWKKEVVHMELRHRYSQLLIRQVTQLKQNGYSKNQIAGGILIPVSEVEEIKEKK